ncbi:hypothetical protein ACLJYM_27485 [Rhizobium giardinii]|uniref:hypothetical protein n=1 Tax=Rhizobium giardinii TaxID=56731 RepID=UPI0039E1B17A
MSFAMGGHIFSLGGHLIRIPLEIIVDSRLVNQLTDMATSADIDVMKEFEVIRSKSVGGPITVNAARNALTKVLAKVRGGGMQLIGKTTEDMAVVFSLTDLATLIRSSAQNRSFGSALDEAGFNPVGKRIVIGARKDGPALKRRENLASTAARSI